MYAIELKNISKKYNLTTNRPLLIKSMISKNTHEEKWALKHVTLNIKKGETIGIIGENGSGKSTLLKIISGITTPTSGTVSINGTVASLIELGAGFHPDLTGKENIYLNASLLGLRKSEIRKKLRTIEEFADIGNYIDQPVRTFSSGMIVRLGFSVTTQLNPDILIIDEVLSVGDLSFQQKSLSLIQKLKEKKKTIFFVSHNLELVSNLCTKIFILDEGKLIKKKKSFSSILYYLEKNRKKIIKNSYLTFIEGVKIQQVKLINIKNNLTISWTEALKIRIKIKFYKDTEKCFIGYIIRDQMNNIFCATNTYKENITIKNKKKNEIVTLNISQNVPFKSGKYYIECHVFPELNENNYFDLIENAAYFYVENKEIMYSSIYLKPYIEIKNN